MDELIATVRRLFGRVARPLPAALIFCGAGLVSALFVITVNRVLSMRPLVPVAALPSRSATSSPQPAPAPSPSPSGSARASCTDAPSAPSDLSGLVIASDAALTLTSGDSTLEVVVPTGAQLTGAAGDLQVSLAVAGRTQSLRGTLVQDLSLCATGGSGMVRVGVAAGTSVTGSAMASSAGIEAVDVRFRASAGNHGGD